MTGMPWVWSEVNNPAWRSTVNKLAQESQIAGMNPNFVRGYRAGLHCAALWMSWPCGVKRARGLLAVLQL